MGEIRAVVFDVSGVLVQPPRLDDRAPADLFGPADHDTDHPWHRLERGELTLAQVQRLTGPPPRASRPVLPYTLDGEFVALAEQLSAAGFGLAICTNAARELVPLWWGLYPWEDIFGVIVKSHEIGARKPSPEPLTVTLARLGAEPGQTLLLDDNAANVAAARRLGMRALLVSEERAGALAAVRELTALRPDSPRAKVGPIGLRRPAARSRADELLLSVLFDPATREDPYPLLHELRSAAPVHRLGHRPIWYLSGYADCRAVLSDRRFVKVSEGPPLDFITGEAVPPPPPGLPAPLPFLDPPAHSGVRAVMSAAFTRGRLRDLEPKLRRTADACVAGMLAAGGGDVVAQVSYPMAITTICDLVGVPEHEREALRRRVREASATFEPAIPPAEMYVAVSAIFTMTEYFTALVKTGPPPGSLLPELLAAARAAGVPDDDVLASVVFLFSAGFETVAHLISTTLFLLATHPGQFARLGREPGLAAAAVTEAGRFHSPVQLDSRMVGEDVPMGGAVIPKDHVAVTLLGAANRDPAVYASPDEFSPGRPGPPPLTFGSGIHYCLGAGLAASQAQMVVEAILAAGVTRLSVADGGVAWKQAMVLRGFDALMLETG